MPRPHRLDLLLASLVGATVLLSGCTSAPTGSTTASPASPSSATTPSTATTPSSAASASPADAVTLNITIKAGQVNPNGDKINVNRGQTVVLHVTSDADDEVHAHTSGDGYELEVKAGVPATGQFVAADTGSFEVESHHLNKIIAILVVR